MVKRGVKNWTDDLHAALLDVTGLYNRPDVDTLFLDRAGIDLDRALLPLLSRIGRACPIGTVELASLVGRDHSTVSRQTAKLEKAGLVERTPSQDDGRMRLLQPTKEGFEMLAGLASTRQEILEYLFNDWTAEDRGLLISMLNRAFANPTGLVQKMRSQEKR